MGQGAGASGKTRGGETGEKGEEKLKQIREEVEVGLISFISGAGPLEEVSEGAGDQTEDQDQVHEGLNWPHQCKSTNINVQKHSHILKLYS